MPERKISLDNAKSDKLFYFVANVVVCRKQDMRCLIVQRSPREKVHPGKWAVLGGKLEWQDLDIRHPTRLNGDVLDYEDAIEKLLDREVFEEAGITIQGPLYFINDVAFVRPDDVPVVLVKFAALYKHGEVRLEPDSFDNFAWVSSSEVCAFDCITGVPEEIKRTITLFSK